MVTAWPSFTARTAAARASAAAGDCRCTGICPHARSTRPTIGRSKSDDLARSRGQRPEKARNWPTARIGIGDVIDDEDHPAGLRNLVLILPISPGQRPEDRVQQPYRADQCRLCRLGVDLREGPQRVTRLATLHDHLLSLVMSSQRSGTEVDEPASPYGIFVAASQDHGKQ